MNPDNNVFNLAPHFDLPNLCEDTSDAWKNTAFDILAATDSAFHHTRVQLVIYPVSDDAGAVAQRVCANLINAKDVTLTADKDKIWPKDGSDDTRDGDIAQLDGVTLSTHNNGNITLLTLKAQNGVQVSFEIMREMASIATSLANLINSLASK